MNHINPCRLHKNHQKGMTLIELCIVIAVIAILSSIAYPTYQRHILKANRSIALTDLVSLQMQMEQIRSRTGEYKPSDLVNAGICGSCNSEACHYQFSIKTGGTGINRYIIKATPVQGSKQAEDDCGVLSINAGAIGEAEGNLKCWP